jgi:hypothetical protein
MLWQLNATNRSDKMRATLLIVLILLSISVATTLTRAEEEPHGCDATKEAELSPVYEQGQAGRHSTLPVSQSLLYDRDYRRILDPVDVYDAIHGNAISHLEEGFVFVTVLSESDGWSQISPERWVPSSILHSDVSVSRFAGVRLQESATESRLAWLLRHVRPSVCPGDGPADDAALIYRYTLVDIYNEIELDGDVWYQIGLNSWVHQFDVARILPVSRPTEVDTPFWISVDLYEQVIVAYEGDVPVFASLVSSGMAEWPTNEGVFRIRLRYPRTVMSGAVGQPDFYYLEEVPWTMYFDGDIALHGAYWHDGFGFRRSHGCVNLTVTDAYWLYQAVTSQINAGNPSPAVYVYSSGTYR